MESFQASYSGTCVCTRRWRLSRRVDRRRDETVKNVFEGPFFELDVALTMGVMKHRRKPGISRSEGQKWWRQLISKPLMWDLRRARRRRGALGDRGLHAVAASDRRDAARSTRRGPGPS